MIVSGCVVVIVTIDPDVGAGATSSMVKASSAESVAEAFDVAGSANELLDVPNVSEDGVG